jgi:hypothetical protein
MKGGDNCFRSNVTISTNHHNKGAQDEKKDSVQFRVADNRFVILFDFGGYGR